MECFFSFHLWGRGERLAQMFWVQGEGASEKLSNEQGWRGRGGVIIYYSQVRFSHQTSPVPTTFCVTLWNIPIHVIHKIGEMKAGNARSHCTDAGQFTHSQCFKIFFFSTKTAWGQYFAAPLLPCKKDYFALNTYWKNLVSHQYWIKLFAIKDWENVTTVNVCLFHLEKCMHPNNCILIIVVKGDVCCTLYWSAKCVCRYVLSESLWTIMNGLKV